MIITTEDINNVNKNLKIILKNPYKYFKIEAFIGNEKIKFCQMINTDKGFLRVYKTKNDLILYDKDRIIEEDLYSGCINLKVIIYNEIYDENGNYIEEIESITTDINEIESLINLYK